MKILYEDEHLLIVDKPAGLSVLPDGWEKDSQYLVKMLEEHYGKIFIVHRLDKITSGVMVFARNAETHRALNIQFENHQAEKIYHAIVEGNPKWDEKVAKRPLRANVGHKHRTMVDDKNGKMYGLPRPMLHAQSLSFIHPASNERVKFSAPHPGDFEEALKILGAAY